MAKKEGKMFEEDFMKSVGGQGLYFYRLKDGASSWAGGESGKSRFQIKNDFDMFVFACGCLLGLELKSVKERSLPDGNIKENQLRGLRRVNSYDDAVGLFIINFRGERETYALNIDDYDRIKEETGKKSININDVRDGGGILIDSTKKRTRYSYHIDIEQLTGGRKND